MLTGVYTNFVAFSAWRRDPYWSSYCGDKPLWREAMLRETRAGEWIDYRHQPWAAPALVNFTDAERKSILGL